MGRKAYVDSKEEVFLKKTLTAYQLNREKLKLWSASFNDYSKEVLKYLEENQQRPVRFERLLADWSRYYLDIHDFLIVMNYGVCVRPSYSLLFKEFLNNKFRDECESSDDNYCEGMEDFDYSLCSNYGLTRYISYLDLKFQGKLENIDTITCTFVNIDEFFSTVRKDLNRVIIQMKTLFKSSSLIKDFKSNATIVEQVAAQDFMMSFAMKEKSINLTYESRVNDNSVPKVYHIYHGPDIVYSRSIIEEPPISARKTSTGRLVRNSEKMQEGSSYVVSQCKADIVTPADTTIRGKKRIIKADTPSDSPLAGPAVVSDEKALLEYRVPTDDSHNTSRLVSTVMSPERSIFLQEKTTVAEPAVLVQQQLASEYTLLGADIDQEAGAEHITDKPDEPEDNFDDFIMGDSEYDKEQLDSDDNSYNSSGEEEVGEEEEEDEEHIEMEIEEETQQQDTFDNNVELESDDDNVPKTFEDCTVIRHFPISQKEFDDEILHLVIDKVGHEVRLETFIVNYLLSRDSNAEVDWLVYHKQLEKRVLNHFELNPAEDGSKITSSKCRKGTPVKERKSMSRAEYNANAKLARKTRKATRSVMRIIVAVSRLMKNRGAGIECQVIPKNCVKLYDLVRSNATLQNAFSQSTEESLSLVERALDAGKQSHEKLPGSIAAAQELESRAQRLHERNSSSLSSTDKPKSAGHNFGGMDDDSQVEKDYAERSRKRAKTNGVDIDSNSMNQSAVLSSATPLCTPQSSVWNSPTDDSSPISDDGDLGSNHHNASSDQDKTSCLTPMMAKMANDDVNSAEHALSELCKPTQTYFVDSDKEVVVSHVDFSWGIDIFLSEILGCITNHGSKCIALVMSKAIVDKWKQAVWNARQLCSEYNIDLEIDEPHRRLNIMRVLAHTSIEDRLVKGALFPILAKFHARVVVGKKINLLYCSNPEQKFRITNYNIGSVDGGVEGLYDVRIVSNSFSFFHTSEYLAKLASSMARKAISVASTPVKTP